MEVDYEPSFKLEVLAHSHHVSKIIALQSCESHILLHVSELFIEILLRKVGRSWSHSLSLRHSSAKLISYNTTQLVSVQKHEMPQYSMES